MSDAIFNSPRICNLIFSCFNFYELVRISKTCRLLKDSISAFLERAYDIHKHLSTHFTDPVAFRNLQARTTALICGSNVLQFLERTTYPDTGLDILVQDKYAKEFGDWIIKDGYELVPSPKQSAGEEATFATIDKFKEKERLANPDYWISDEVAAYMEEFKKIVNVSTFKKGGKKVHLICTRDTPMHSIHLAQSTCVMNYITHEGAYHLYPRATFIERLCAGLKQLMEEEDKMALQKYESRGWKIIITDEDLPSPRQKLFDIFWLERLRHPRDEHTWYLPLNTDDIDLKYRNEYNPAVYSSWRMRHEYYINDSSEFDILSHFIRHERLAHEYRVDSISSELNDALNTVLEQSRDVAPGEKLDKVFCEKAAELMGEIQSKEPKLVVYDSDSDYYEGDGAGSEDSESDDEIGYCRYSHFLDEDIDLSYTEFDPEFGGELPMWLLLRMMLSRATLEEDSDDPSHE